MAIDQKNKSQSSKPAASASTAASAPASNEAASNDPWADYSSLAEATKTKSGFPVLRSLAGETVFITTLEMDEGTKTYLATLVNVDPATKQVTGEKGKYAVPPTYAKKLAAALKARPQNAPGIRVRLGEQKRGIGLS